MKSSTRPARACTLATRPTRTARLHSRPACVLRDAYAHAVCVRPQESIFIGLNTLTFSLRVGLVLLAAFLAVSVPNFGFLVALMGCVTTMLVSFILPTAFYLQVHWRSGLSVPTLVGCFGILLLGFVGMGIGLYNTLVAGI